MIIQVHPTANVYVREELKALIEAQLLSEFWTCISWNAHSPISRALPSSLAAQLGRRALPPQARPFVRQMPLREIGRLLAPALKLGRFTRHERGVFSVDQVFRALDRRVARHLQRARAAGATAVYAHEDGALHSFRRAKALGLTCIYELPIAYWETSRRLLETEAQRWPDWEPTLVGTRNSAAKLERKTRELELADLVITPGQFVYDSLPANVRASKPCLVAPFGSPAVDKIAFERAEALRQEQPRARPLRVLFAGSLSQRKGLADLFAAFRLLKRADIELVLLGAPVAPLEFYRAQGVHFRYEAPRAHAEVLELMRACDLLALPSIVEGRALVQQEALACGLPILVTPNAGAQDLIDEAQTGFLVPIRSPEKIAEKIAWLADNREQLPAMRRAALAKAEAYTWQTYRRSITEFLRLHLATEI